MCFYTSKMFLKYNIKVNGDILFVTAKAQSTERVQAKLSPSGNGKLLYLHLFFKSLPVVVDGCWTLLLYGTCYYISNTSKSKSIPKYSTEQKSSEFQVFSAIVHVERFLAFFNFSIFQIKTKWFQTMLKSRI